MESILISPTGKYELEFRKINFNIIGNTSLGDYIISPYSEDDYHKIKEIIREKSEFSSRYHHVSCDECESINVKTICTLKTIYGEESQYQCRDCKSVWV